MYRSGGGDGSRILGAVERALPGAWAGQGASVVEGVFAEGTVGAGVIDGNEARDDGGGGRGLHEGHGLLIDDGAGSSADGDVGEAEPLDAVLVAEAEVNAFGSGQVSGEAADEDVVFGGDGALDAATGRGGVFADAQALLDSTLEEAVTDNEAQGALAGELTDSFGEGDRFTETRAAGVAGEEVFFDGVFFGRGQGGEPVVGENGDVNGAGAIHNSTPMQARN